MKLNAMGEREAEVRGKLLVGVWSKGVVWVWCGGFGARHGEISF